MVDEPKEAYDSWDQYRESLRLRMEGPQNEVPKFLPSPKEIKRRIKMLQWLRQKEFSDKLQDSIMIDDCPTIDVVQRLVETVGLKETKRRLESFLKDE